MKSSKNAFWVAALVALLFAGDTSADGDRFLESQFNLTTSAPMAMDRQVAVTGSTLKFHQAPAATPACVCTNLRSVTVICPDCDAETDENRCHIHDNACKDRVQLGGIREVDDFYCVTPRE